MFKNKLKFFSIVALVFASIFLIIGFAQASTPQYGWGDFPIPLPIPGTWITTNAIIETLLNLFGLLIALIRSAMVPIIEDLLEVGITQTAILFNDPNTPHNFDIAIIWNVLRGFANSIFLLALLIISILIIARVNTGIYNIKKFLGGFVLAIALANFSLLIVRALLGISILLENAIFNMATVLPGLENIATNGRESIMNYLHALLNIDMVRFGGGHAINEIVILLIIAVLSVWVAAKLALLLIERIIRLFILMITAPVVFAASLLPSYRDVARSWWANVIKWILVLPFTFALIILSIFLTYMAGFETFGELQNFRPPFLGGTMLFLEFDLRTITYLVLAIYTLYLAGDVNNLLKLGSVSTGVIETPQKALNLAGKGVAVGRKVIGAGAVLAGQGLKRQVLAGSFNNLPDIGLPGGKKIELGTMAKKTQEKAAGWEAWKSRQTAGPMGMIFNPEGRGEVLKFQGKKAVSEKAIEDDIADNNAALEPLNTAAQAQFQTNWLALDGDQKDTLLSDPTIKSANNIYKEKNATMLWRAREHIKDERMEDWAPVDELQKDFEKGGFDGMVAAVKLSRISASKNNPEREDAQTILNNPEATTTLEEKYGLGSNKLRKGRYAEPGEQTPTHLSAALANRNLPQLENAITGSSSQITNRLLREYLDSDEDISLDSPTMQQLAKLNSDELLLLQNNWDDIQSATESSDPGDLMLAISNLGIDNTEVVKTISDIVTNSAPSAKIIKAAIGEGINLETLSDQLNELKTLTRTQSVATEQLTPSPETLNTYQSAIEAALRNLDPDMSFAGREGVTNMENLKNYSTNKQEVVVNASTIYTGKLDTSTKLHQLIGERAAEDIVKTIKDMNIAPGVDLKNATVEEVMEKLRIIDNLD